MVVFGAASFIAPGAVPNYFKLALQCVEVFPSLFFCNKLRRYLRRPRLDVLEMIAQNKGVFGFNLIWCARPAWCRSCTEAQTDICFEIVRIKHDIRAGCGIRWT